jgi:hypothetical protein
MVRRPRDVKNVQKKQTDKQSRNGDLVIADQELGDYNGDARPKQWPGGRKRRIMSSKNKKKICLHIQPGIKP